MTMAKHPALDELQEKLVTNGVDADVVRVATAILGVVGELNHRPKAAAIADWIEQLAIDVANIGKPDGVSVTFVGRSGSVFVVPEGFPLRGLAEEQGTQVADRVGAVLAPTHAGSFQPLADHTLARRFHRA